MLIARYAKIVMSLSLAAFCLLVTFDNIADYGTNYLFVQHVMSMDTTFPGNTLMYRAIDDPVLWQLAYALIIAAEGVTGLLFLAGGIQLVRLRSASGAAFNQGKTLVIAGCLLAFLAWFLGFMDLVFLGMTGNVTHEVRRLIAWRVARNAFFVLVGSLSLGALILRFYGISIPVLRVAGGIIVAVAGWKLLTEGSQNMDSVLNIFLLELAALFPVVNPGAVGQTIVA